MKLDISTQFILLLFIQIIYINALPIPGKFSIFGEAASHNTAKLASKESDDLARIAAGKKGKDLRKAQKDVAASHAAREANIALLKKNHPNGLAKIAQEEEALKTSKFMLERTNKLRLSKGSFLERNGLYDHSKSLKKNFKESINLNNIFNIGSILLVLPGAYTLYQHQQKVDAMKAKGLDPNLKVSPIAPINEEKTEEDSKCLDVYTNAACTTGKNCVDKISGEPCDTAITAAAVTTVSQSKKILHTESATKDDSSASSESSCFNIDTFKPCNPGDDGCIDLNSDPCGSPSSSSGGASKDAAKDDYSASSESSCFDIDTFKPCNPGDDGCIDFNSNPCSASSAGSGGQTYQSPGYNNFGGAQKTQGYQQQSGGYPQKQYNTYQQPPVQYNPSNSYPPNYGHVQGYPSKGYNSQGYNSHEYPSQGYNAQYAGYRAYQASGYNTQYKGYGYQQQYGYPAPARQLTAEERAAVNDRVINRLDQLFA